MIIIKIIISFGPRNPSASRVNNTRRWWPGQIQIVFSRHFALYWREHFGHFSAHLAAQRAHQQRLLEHTEKIFWMKISMLKNILGIFRAVESKNIIRKWFSDLPTLKTPRVVFCTIKKFLRCFMAYTPEKLIVKNFLVVDPMEILTFQKKKIFFLPVCDRRRRMRWMWPQIWCPSGPSGHKNWPQTLLTKRWALCRKCKSNRAERAQDCTTRQLAALLLRY